MCAACANESLSAPPPVLPCLLIIDLMDLSQLERDYIAHTTGQASSRIVQQEAAPIDSPVSLWKNTDLQTMAHLDLRSLLPSVSSPTRKTGPLGLSITAQDDAVAMDSVASPIIGTPVTDPLPTNWSLPPSLGFVEWQPKRA